MTDDAQNNFDVTQKTDMRPLRSQLNQVAPAPIAAVAPVSLNKGTKSHSSFKSSNQIDWGNIGKSN